MLLTAQCWEGVQNSKYYLVQTMPQLQEMIAFLENKPMLAVDTETSGLDWVRADIAGIVLGCGAEHNYYIPIGHKNNVDGGRSFERQLTLQDVLVPLQRLLGDPKKSYVLWNAKYDLHMLRKVGIEINGQIHDGLPLSFLLDENCDHSLKGMATALLDKNADKWEKDLKAWRIKESKRRRSEFSNLLKLKASELKKDLNTYTLALLQATKQVAEMNIEDEKRRKRNITAKTTAALKAMAKEFYKGHFLERNKIDDISYDYVPLDIITPYACADTHYTWMLFKRFFFELVKHKNLPRLYMNELGVTAILFPTEHIGIKIDKPHLEKLGPQLQTESERLEKVIYEQAGREFNANSTMDVLEVLQDAGCKLHKLTKKTLEKLEKGEEVEKRYAVDSEVLELLAVNSQIAHDILEYRRSEKLRSTYVDSILQKIDDNQCLHTHYNQNVKTGRMSSSSPNLQNIPADDKRIRRAFIVSNDDELLVLMDYAQIELKLCAHITQDPALLLCYPFEGEGCDVHSLTCAEVVRKQSYEELLKDLKDYTDHTESKEKECECVACVAQADRKIAKCVHPDTLVFSNKKGYIPIKSIYHFSDRSDEFHEIKDDLSVSNGSGGVASIKSTYNGGIKKMLRVTTSSGLIECSENHLFVNEDGTLTKACDLKKGQILKQADIPLMGDYAYPEISCSLYNGVPTTYFKTSAKWARLAGIYAGDGCSQGETVSICGGRIGKLNEYGEDEYRLWNLELIQFLTDMEFNTSSRTQETATTVGFGCRMVRRLLTSLEMLDLDGYRKFRVPSWVLQAGKEACLHYIGGLIDTDGWVTRKKGTVGICNKDGVFVGQVATIARACGLPCSVTASWNRDYERWYYECYFYKSANHMLSEYMRHPNKKTLIDTSGKCRNKNVLRANKVRLVEEIGEGPCLDISLNSSDHLYLTNTIITHNTCNFASLYQAGPKALQQQLSSPQRYFSLDQCKNFIDGYFRKYKSVKKCIKLTEMEVLQNGYVVNEFGRYRRFSKEELTDNRKFRAFRQAFSHRIQSTAADLFKFAMNKVAREIKGTGIRFVNVIHDEIQFIVPKKEVHYLSIIKKAMEDFKFSVPITVDVSWAEHGHWASKKSIENLEEFCDRMAA